MAEETRFRRVERPRPVEPVRNLARLPAPVAGGSGGDDVAVAIGRRAGRRGKIAVGDAKLHKCV
jgi:hypothetical protein